eukprot:2277656-Lingulodinium_polyedra.AAC.1
MQQASGAMQSSPAAGPASAAGASGSNAPTPIDGTWNHYAPPARAEKPKELGQNKATLSMMGPA